MFKYSPIILSLFLITSCSPEKRLHRIAQKYDLIKVDTLVVRDSVFIPSIEADTALIWSQLTDTITIERERLKIKILRSHDTLKVFGECKGDTIIRIVKVPYEKIVISETFADKYGQFLIILLFFIVGFVIWKFLLN